MQVYRVTTKPFWKYLPEDKAKTWASAHIVLQMEIASALKFLLAAEEADTQFA